MDIFANNKLISEGTAKMLEKIKADSGEFGLDGEEIRIIEKLQLKVETGWLNRAMWKVEELGVFLWVLGLLDDVPPVWRQFDEEVLKRTKDLKSVANIRESVEIEKYREYLQTVNWRFHFDIFSRMGNISKQTDQAKIIAEKAEELRGRGVIDEVVDGDIGFEGVSFAKLDYYKKNSIKSIAEVRYKVFEWLEEDEA